MNENLDGVRTERVLRSRKQNIEKQKTIQKNLKNLEVKSRIKKDAQARYYSEDGRKRLNQKLDDEHKKPVHARLGRKKYIIRRTIGDNGLVTKKWLMRRGNFKVNQSGFITTNSFQYRLQRPDFSRNNFKTSLQYRLQKPHLNNNLQSSVQYRLQKPRLGINWQTSERNGAVVNQTQKIKLKRKRNHPKNITIQVNNDDYNTAHTSVPGFIRHSIRAQLNAQMQFEIKAVQARNTNPREIIEPFCILPLGTGFTNISLNDRFSRL